MTTPAVRETQPKYGTKKQGEYTLKDYLAIPDERRVELIDGVIYDMSSPLGHHQIIAGQIHFDLLSYISRKGGLCLPFIAPIDVRLDCDDKTIVQPDVLILCDRNKYTPERIVGAPGIIIMQMQHVRTYSARIRICNYSTSFILPVRYPCRSIVI